MERLTIETTTKSYPVFIGEALRSSVGELIDRELKLKPSAIMIISDETVARLYLDDVKKSFAHSSVNVFEFVIPSGEQSKSFELYYEIQTACLENGLDRKSLIIALGGGVVGDLAGFVAATFMRGIPFIQVPTTLLAHDSSVGGKVAINHPLGKNMIGAFHQPEAVIYDIDSLASLSEKEWASGFAEVMKHAYIWDQGLYIWLRETIQSFSQIEGQVATELLKRSISVKAAIVSQDERETGIRAYLNFGHTLGHAIETELGYGKITHGEAVVIGMVFATVLSERIYGKSLDVQAMRAWFEQLQYQVDIPKGLHPATLVETMKKDKKAEHGTIRMVLLKAIGEVELYPVPEATLVECLNEFMRGELGE